MEEKLIKQHILKYLTNQKEVWNEAVENGECGYEIVEAIEDMINSLPKYKS